MVPLRLMLYRFSLLFLCGLIIVSPLFILQRDPPLLQPTDREPRLEWEYEKYLGFCYSGGVEEYSRGDLLVYGKNGEGKKGRGKVYLWGALYRSRGEEATVSLEQTGQPAVRSKPLGESGRWRKVEWLSPVPWPVDDGSRGTFTFEFSGVLLNNSCTWDFRF